MEKAVLFAVVASFCTATASVCQRIGARNTGTAAGFDARLIFRLARQPVWLLGIAAMIGGFVFQLTALRFGELALVQPILAAELLLVFGYMAVAGSGGRSGATGWLPRPCLPGSSCSSCWPRRPAGGCTRPAPPGCWPA